MNQETTQRQSIISGPIAWMAGHKVAANLVMILLLVGGLAGALLIKQEVFPDFALDMVNVQLVYPGASPEEVEKGAVLAVEEAVRGIDGVDVVTASAREGGGTVTVELLNGTNPDKALADIKAALDRITTLPEEMEQYTVSLFSRKRSVLNLVVYGDQEEGALRALAEKVRADLLTNEHITVIDMNGARNPEISLEIDEETLRAHGLTLDEVAMAVRAASVEMPAGKLKTDSGEILLRTSQRRYQAREYANLPVKRGPDGNLLTLGEIADLREGFEDVDLATLYGDQAAVVLQVYRVGDQGPIQISEAVHAYMAQSAGNLPAGVGLAVWNDMSEALRDRIDLLLKNTFMGLVLVLLLLGLFLEPRLAFWVTMGIPISILGSLLFVPAVDVSINMISLFAFIITIGVVVDDAVVVGEHIFAFRQKGMPAAQAAVLAAKEMAVPVTFSILTNVVAFLPLFFVPGVMGKLFKTIPLIVITVFLISLFEAIFILPSHLSHEPRPAKGITAFLERGRLKFGRGLDGFITRIYQPLLRVVVRRRYATVSAGLFLLLVVGGLVASGRVPFIFFPKVEGDVITANMALPIGTPMAQTQVMRDRLMAAANQVIHQNGGPAIVRGSMSWLGVSMGSEGDAGESGGHLATVQFFLVPMDRRTLTAETFADAWREAMGKPAGLESLSFNTVAGPSGGKPIQVELSHSDNGILEAAATDLAERLSRYHGVKDIDDGFSAGKQQWDFQITEQARSMGLSAGAVATQVRHAFYGAEALRSQRGRDEVKVMVRYPERRRRSVTDVRHMILRTPAGGEIPLSEAAVIKEGRAYTTIRRRDGFRVVDVSGDVVEGQTDANKVLASLRENALVELTADYPGLRYAMRGQAEEQMESMTSLATGFVFALFCIFALLAIPFNSYYQPLIIMVSIPFGIVGAVLGHMMMGYALSLMSMMGIVALSGVVVNDALILIVAANREQERGKDLIDAIQAAALSRFRPILITSLSTFLGLGPMILETSVQARFLVPMAISLGFGIMFATLIVLLLVPGFYLILEDIKGLLVGRKGLRPATPLVEMEARA